MNAVLDLRDITILVTHEARHAAWADRVVYLRDGVLVGRAGPIDSPDSLLETR